MSVIESFVPCRDEGAMATIVQQFENCPLVTRIYLLTGDSRTCSHKAEALVVESLTSSGLIKTIAAKATAEYVMVCTKDTRIVPGQFALDRMVGVARDTGAAMVYSDYYKMADTELSPCPVNDYQQGSLRDDFNFGSVWLLKTSLLKKAASEMTDSYRFAGWYDLRLRLSEMGELFHINELLYTEVDTDTRKSGEKQFDYVDPRNRAVQLEMEDACTAFLKRTGAWLKPDYEAFSPDATGFPVEASVIIPVKNRAKTLMDAIRSVLMQKTSFPFNLIIIDNYSTDGTTVLIEEAAAADNRIVHIIPGRKDLGIGGCWNEGVFSDSCGKFAVQLDSDDVYKDENTLQKIVDAFYDQQCAMVIGSYTMTDFGMNVIPPGLIDHREWTDANGRNNALRINGLGAPRAFYTPVLRAVKVPNTSYGEDYALGLAISRRYRIGRIYESLYLCRRWDDNSDASLDISKLNIYNAYKDKLRTVEIKARLSMNRSNQ